MLKSAKNSTFIFWQCKNLLLYYSIFKKHLKTDTMTEKQAIKSIIVVANQRLAGTISGLRYAALIARVTSKKISIEAQKEVDLYNEDMEVTADAPFGEEWIDVDYPTPSLVEA